MKAFPSLIVALLFLNLLSVDATLEETCKQLTADPGVGFDFNFCITTLQVVPESNKADAIALSSLSLVTSHRFMVGSCHASGYLRGKTGHCNTEHDSDCCKAGKMYPQYRCSPPITSNTRATMTINSFAKGGDGGGPSECDNQYHSDSELVVALSTGWYNGGSRCLNYININANGKSVRAKVVDECDSVHGCDADHDFQPPCPNNIVDASPAVWKALDIPESQVGDYDITWSDA